jgi:hypothetical protein
VFRCPLCQKENFLQAIDIAEAGKLCMLCELENVCLACQKKKHPELWGRR